MSTVVGRILRSSQVLAMSFLICHSFCSLRTKEAWSIASLSISGREVTFSEMSLRGRVAALPHHISYFEEYFSLYLFATENLQKCLTPELPRPSSTRCKQQPQPSLALVQTLVPTEPRCSRAPTRVQRRSRRRYLA